MSDGERRTGEIVMWDQSRGFGFARADGGGKNDFFVHVKDCAGGGELSVGDRVSFTVGQGRKRASSRLSA